MKTAMAALLGVVVRIEVDAEQDLSRESEFDDLRHAVGRVYGMRRAAEMMLAELSDPDRSSADFYAVRTALDEMKARTDERVDFHYERIKAVRS